MQCAPPAPTRSRHLWQIHADRQECPSWQVTTESTDKPADTDTTLSSATELEAAQKDETISKISKPVEGEPAPMETSKPVEGKPAAEKRALDETENADQNVPPQKKQSPGVQGKTEPVISAQEAATASEC